MEYKVLNNGLKMPMVGLGVYNISERETQREVPDSERHYHHPKDDA